MEKITESDSPYRDLEKMPLRALLEGINAMDQTVPEAVAKAIPQIEALVEKLVANLEKGGKLFYIGAGTSGRLGVVDASEIPPTYGAPPELVTGIIAGGDGAIRKSVEGAEDNPHLAWENLRDMGLSAGDFVIGIAASGTTPYVVHGLLACQQAGISTGCITCNPNAPVLEVADYPVMVLTGPEFVTGSTRMKAGTAQKLVLNMISTTAMIRLGRVKDNRMVDMHISNAKLTDRGVKMVVRETGLNEDTARQYLLQYGSVRAAVAAWSKAELKP